MPIIRSRNIPIYLGTFVITVLASLVLTLARSVYVHRQAVFVSAASNGNLVLMRGLEVLGVDVNAPACKHQNCILPLVGAAWNGQRETALFLIERGADVNEGGRFDKTPLMMASYCGETEVVKLLLAKGADVNLTNSDGESALSFAKQKKQSSVIRLLREAGAKELSSQACGLSE